MQEFDPAGRTFNYGPAGSYFFGGKTRLPSPGFLHHVGFENLIEFSAFSVPLFFRSSAVVWDHGATRKKTDDGYENQNPCCLCSPCPSCAFSGAGQCA